MNSKIKPSFFLILVILSFQLISNITCIGEYYTILGLNSDATEQDIKKAFKKLAVKYHPDRTGPSQEAKEKFLQISKAYAVLSDQEKKALYDSEGESGLADHKSEKTSKNIEKDFDEIYKDFFSSKMAEKLTDLDEDLFAHTDVIKLSFNNYLQLVKRNEIWLVLFYHTTDKDLDKISMEWKWLASKSYGIVKIAYVSCRVSEEFCERFDVKETPKILFFGEGGYGLTQHEEYKGRKNWKDMFTFASNSMISFVRTIDKDNYLEFLRDNPSKFKVLLFTDKSYIPAIMKALSKRFSDKLFFGVVKNADKSLLTTEMFKIQTENLPQLLVLDNGWNYSGIPYKGTLLIDQVEKFLAKYSKREVKVTGKYYELNRDIIYKKKMCDSKYNKTCVIYIIKKSDINDKDKEQMQFIADRYYKDDNLKIFYLLLGKYGLFYETLQEEDEGSDLVIYKGKSGKYIAFSLLNSVKFFSEEVTSYVDNILGGIGDYKIQRRPLSLQEKKKSDL